MRVFICLRIGDNMKKLIKIMAIGITFFIMSKDCYAMNIINGDEISDVKIRLKTNNINEVRIVHKITNLYNDEIMYSADLENTNYSNIYDACDYYSWENTIEKKSRKIISLIAYFGYGYKDRTDIKWYVITQYLIWEELIKNENGEIYFLDNNSNKVDLYKNEIAQIYKDIEHFYSLPSFLEQDKLESEYNLKLTEELIFEDKNNIIDEFEITLSSNDLKYKKEDNKIIITPINPNLINMSFQRKMDEAADYIKIYLNSTSQKLISRGNIQKDTKVLTININFPKVKIISNIIDAGKFNMQNNKYTIFNEDGSEFYSNITLDKKGISDEYIFIPGKYYLKQTENAYGYKLNEEKIYFEINKEDVIIDIKNELEKKQLIIEKQLVKDNKEIVFGANAVFRILDNDNKLVKEAITNNEGRAIINLSYGTYKIVENKNQKSLEETFTITIDENFNENEVIILKEELAADNNEEEVKKGNVIFTKYDYLTGNPLNGVKIGLFNSNMELVNESITDNFGKAIFKDIETGTYYIKEILKDGDYGMDNAIKIEVKENIDTVISSNNRTKIEVPNTISKSIDFNILINILLIGIGIYMNKYKCYEKEKSI